MFWALCTSLNFCQFFQNFSTKNQHLIIFLFLANSGKQVRPIAASIKEGLLKVRQNRNGFLKPTIPPKNERTNSVFWPNSTMNEYFRSFFGGN